MTGKPIRSASAMAAATSVTRLAAARRYRHARALHQVPGPDLVAHLLDRRRVRADPGQAGRDDLTGEVRVLGQETVTRVHRGRPGLAGRLHDRRGVQVAPGGLGGTDAHRLVGLADVRQVRVGVGVHRDGPDPHPPGRPQHAPGDLAPVGDKHRIEHQPSLLGPRQSWMTDLRFTTRLSASTASGSYSLAVSSRSCCTAAAARPGSSELPTRSSKALAALMMRLLSGGRDGSPSRRTPWLPGWPGRPR